MTYQQYYNKLIKDIADSKKHIAEQNKTLKGEKGYMDQTDMYTYMKLQTDLNSLLFLCEEIARMITSGNVALQDEVDLLKYPGAAEN